MSFVASDVRSVRVSSGASRLCNSSVLFGFDLAKLRPSCELVFIVEDSTSFDGNIALSVELRPLGARWCGIYSLRLERSFRRVGSHKNCIQTQVRDFRVVEALDQVAKQLHAAPTQVVLAWLIARPTITAPIASATSLAQLKELMSATKLKLDEASMGLLNRASDWRG